VPFGGGCRSGALSFFHQSFFLPFYSLQVLFLPFERQ
jgi:hypothetical protein